MKRYTYKNIRIENYYGTCTCYYNDGANCFKLAVVDGNKKYAYEVAKAQVDFLNGKQ